jgi:hypothetical protein
MPAKLSSQEGWPAADGAAPRTAPGHYGAVAAGSGAEHHGALTGAAAPVSSWLLG